MCTICMCMYACVEEEDEGEEAAVPRTLVGLTMRSVVIAWLVPGIINIEI